MTRLLKAVALVSAMVLSLACTPVFSATARANSGYDPANPVLSGDPILSSDGNFLYVHFYTDQSNTAVSPNVDIFSYVGSGSNVTVPPELDGLSVECVLGCAFNSDNSDIPVQVENVTISEGIQYLGDNVFEDCSELEKVSLPSTMHEFTKYEFGGCPALKEIAVASGNAFYSSIGGVLYNNDVTTLLFYPPAKSDASFTVPDTVKLIQDMAFSGAKNLSGITIPASVTKIGTAVFGSYDVVGGEVFHGCTSLSSITVDAANAVYYSSDGVLYGRDTYEGKILLMQYPLAKPEADFTIPDGVTTICFNAFSGNSSLETLDIPDSVTEILPLGFNEVVENPFNCCSKLKSITVDGGNPAFAVKDGVLFNLDLNTLICYPEGLPGGPSTGHYPLTSAKAAARKKLDSLKGKLASLGSLAGKLPSDLLARLRKSTTDSIKTELTRQSSAAAGLIADATGYYDVPDSTKTIASWAFGGTKLATVEIPNSVSRIAPNSFQDADGVSICANSTSYAHQYAEDMGIPFIAAVPSKDGFTYDLDDSGNAIITGYSGDECAITIPDTITDSAGTHTVTAIGDGAFESSGGDSGNYTNGEIHLTSVAIPDTVETIGDGAFAGTGLTSVKIPDSVTSIGEGCFEFCVDLESIKLPSQITRLEDETFSGCFCLKDILLPDGIKSLGEDCFGNCESLAGIHLPDGIKSIGSGCFEYCSSLAGVDLPESLQSIGGNCFFLCQDLAGSVTIPDNVSSIGQEVFWGCDLLTAIDVENGNAYYSSSDGVLYDIGRSALMCYPSGKAGLSYEIPGEMTTVDGGAISGDCPLVTVSVGAAVNDIEPDAFNSTNLQAIVVDRDNANYSNNIVNNISDNVLYDKMITAILCYPMAKPDKVYNIPKSISDLSGVSLAGRLFETVNIPKSVRVIDLEPFPPFFFCGNLLNINVASDNPNYASLCGVLTDKGKKKILQFPFGRSGDYSIPSGVTTVGNFAFCPNNLTSVSFPASIKTLGISAFALNLKGSLKMAIFYGNVYKADPDPENGPFEDMGPNFKVYYNISKTASWKSFHAYDKQPFCTLTLNLQDGEANKAIVAPITLTGSTFGTIAMPAAPTRTGFTFGGWFKDAACKKPWYSSSTVSNDITLYAQWIATAVTGVQGTPLTYNSIKVSWTAISGVSGYEVSRSTKPDSDFKVLGTSTTAAYTDKTAVTGTPYYYRVRAFVKYGSAKIYGDYSDVSLSVAASLAKPDSVKAVRQSATSIKVSWGKVAGATKYEIRQYIGSPSGSYTSFFSTSASYTDKKLTTGTTYYYVVVAYRKVGSGWVLSGASDPVSAMP